MRTELEIVKFDVNDIVTASGDTGCSEQGEWD